MRRSLTIIYKAKMAMPSENTKILYRAEFSKYRSGCIKAKHDEVKAAFETNVTEALVKGKGKVL